MNKDDVAGAIAAYKEAIRERPDYAPAHYNLALALQKAGDNASAQAQFAEAKRLDPESGR